MSKLFKYFKNYTLESVLAPLFKMCEALLELLTPLIVASIIDRGIGNGDTTHVILMCLLMAGCALVGMVISITAQYFSAKASVGFATTVRRELFDHVLRLPSASIDASGASGILTRLTSDVDKLQSGVNLALRLALRSPFIVFGSVIMAFVVAKNDIRLALIFCVLVFLLSVVVFGIILWGIPLFSKVQRKLDKVTRRIRDNLRGVRVIRAFNHEKHETDEFERENNDYTRENIFAGNISSLLNPITFVIVNLSIIALIRLGAFSVDGGKLTQGELIALYNYLAQILVELVKLANIIVSMTKAGACARRIADVLESDVEEDQQTANADPIYDEAAPLLEFDSVSLKYDSSSEASLSDLSFSLAAGEVLGVLGGTGSGKSTLINLIPRFYRASKGEIRFKGVNVNDIPAGSLRDKIAVVPQYSLLFSGSVRSNMLWGCPEADDEDIKDVLRSAEALDFVEAKDGLDTAVEQGGKNFSGGQRQRLAIARALMRKPDILILDDSFSALDFATDLRLRTNISRLSYKPATIIVSQRPSAVINADKIIVLDDGVPVGIGSHTELISSCEVYREIYASQYGGDSK